MTPDASRTWFLTWTTYGTWLPGDRRSFVGPVREITSDLKVTRRESGVPYESADVDLEASALARMRGRPVRLRAEQAMVVAEQIEATATHRGWTLHASAIMPNHVHVVVAVPGDPDPEGLLRDFKAYASRALNARFGNPQGGTWWTKSGSKRKCVDEDALMTRVRYVRDQPGALVVRLHAEYASWRA